MDFVQEVARCHDCWDTYPTLCRDHQAVIADAIAEANLP